MASMVSSRNTDLILKLTELTQAGTIIWTPVDPPPSKAVGVGEAQGEYWTSVYTTEYKGKSLQIHREHRLIEEPTGLQKLMIGATARMAIDLLGLNKAKELTKSERQYPYWDSEVVLDMIDHTGDILMSFPTEFPMSSRLNDLMKAITHQISGVDDWINDVLNE